MGGSDLGGNHTILITDWPIFFTLGLVSHTSWSVAHHPRPPENLFPSQVFSWSPVRECHLSELRCVIILPRECSFSADTLWVPGEKHLRRGEFFFVACAWKGDTHTHTHTFSLEGGFTLQWDLPPSPSHRCFFHLTVNITLLCRKFALCAASVHHCQPSLPRQSPSVTTSPCCGVLCSQTG